ncbi:hypothetical protein Ccar_13925 [Clostridium carboxidivorans P7]|uniref:Major facilitator superfamily MFS_1 n=1 Tax=Clostridium carboxidivorans P7 TaxID=536227 RepID=C6PS55_9CLOT|nr:MFS transporter [Clostridium carboxidivorans]AKN31897.1 hypothetical protein Ccar_13925 [Clostridium carboxidivorans P7]EET87980.1 major facilitator superfamily MFS_1 [Clostridium carboxidivorans P7]
MKFSEKKQYRWIVLLICMLIYCTAELVRWNYTGVTKYLISDWGVTKPQLGILGSVFFYAYALGQVPWGMVTDKFGGTRVIPLGLCALALCVVGFSLSGNLTQGIVWRAVMGFMSGASFIPASAVLTKWFNKKERGFAMTMFIGAGGGLGEIMTFLLMPIFALILSNGRTLFGLSNWRASSILSALTLIIIGCIAFAFLRPAPSDIEVLSKPKIDKPDDEEKVSYLQSTKAILADIKFWLFAFMWSGFTVGTRLIPGWIVMYATDFYTHYGMNKEKAIIAGGLMSTIYVLGRAVGTPLVGLLSDFLLRRGIPRSVIVCVVQVLMFIMYYSYTLPIPSPILLGILAFVTGILINLVSMMNALGAELWSSKTYGATVGLANMVGQFIGAIMLGLSGYMAAKYSVKGGAFYTEFSGIWYLGMMYSTFTSILAVFFYKMVKRVHNNLKNDVQEVS